MASKYKEANLLACLEFAIENGGRADLEVGRAAFSQDVDGNPIPKEDRKQVKAYKVSGCGLGGGYHQTFLEALTGWILGLIQLSVLDPAHYKKYAPLERILEYGKEEEREEVNADS
jgi:hypothetical protein